MDIAVHTIVDGHGVKELYKANGGPWGGTCVDKAFFKFIENIVGVKTMENFRRDEKYDELDLLHSFEVKKRTISSRMDDNDDRVTLKVPLSLEILYKKINKGKTLKQLLDEQPISGGNLTWSKGKLSMNAGLAKSFFINTCNSIVTHVKDIFSKPQLQEVDTILMVGGFAEATMLIEAIKANFPKKKVVIPRDAGLAVLKGAVLFGHQPQRIVSRVCRYTYGIESLLPFEHGKDDRKYYLLDANNREMCQSRFSVHVKEGDEVGMNCPPHAQEIDLPYPDQLYLYIPVYVALADCPRYVQDCTKVGDIRITVDEVPDNKERKFKLEMIFGYIESTVRVTDLVTGSVKHAKFDFLG